MKSHILDYKIVEGKQGQPLVAIRFACDDTKVRTWYGSFSGKAEEHTLDALIRCGFSGSDPLELAGGVDSGLLDTDKELYLTIGMETYEGKTREKVQWINEVEGGAFKNEIKKEDAVKKFAGMNLKAKLAARKAMSPKKDEEDAPF